jgi:hypothetical protein
MATERLSMRKTKEILRQKWLLTRTHRAAAASVGVSLGAVHGALTRAEAAGLDWPAVDAMTEEALEAALYKANEDGGGALAARAMPDCAYLHAERKKPRRSPQSRPLMIG